MEEQIFLNPCLSFISLTISEKDKATRLEGQYATWMEKGLLGPSGETEPVASWFIAQISGQGRKGRLSASEAVRPEADD